MIKLQHTYQGLITQVRNAQNQQTIWNVICNSTIGSQIIQFVIGHYNSVYDQTYHAWCKSTSYKPTDLNNAKNMVLTAARAV